MGRIVAHTFATLDGVIAPPDEAFGPYMDDEVTEQSTSLLHEVDGVLLGRETHHGLAQAWREQSGPIADRLNAMPKYAVSRTLASGEEWEHTTVVGYGDVPGLRLRSDLVSYGCGRLARDLLVDGLLDELQLWLVPVVAGSGRRLFDEPTELLKLQLTDTRPFDTGAVRLRYRPAPTP